MPTSRATKSTTQEATANTLDALRRLSRGLRLAAQETQAAAGVSAAQLFVLRSLESVDDMSVTQLAELTMTDRSSVASVVDRLIDAKLASRVTSASDRRRAAISITAKGRNVLRKAPAAPANTLIDGLRALSGPEIKALSTSLTRLVEVMGLEKGPAYMLFEEAPKKPRR